MCFQDEVLCQYLENADCWTWDERLSRSLEQLTRFALQVFLSGMLCWVWLGRLGRLRSTRFSACCGALLGDQTGDNPRWKKSRAELWGAKALLDCEVLFWCNRGLFH